MTAPTHAPGAPNSDGAISDVPISELPISEVIDRARRVIETLRKERDTARDQIEFARSLIENTDLALTRRIVFNIAGDFLTELSTKRLAADEAVKLASSRAANTSSVASNSARRFTETRRLRAQLSKAKARAKQAKAKFQLVFDTVRESDKFRKQFDEQRAHWTSELSKARSLEAEIEQTIAELSDTISGLVSDRTDGVASVYVDLPDDQISQQASISKTGPSNGAPSKSGRPEALDVARTLIECREVLKVEAEEPLEPAN
jgi:hypothetical protein